MKKKRSVKLFLCILPGLLFIYLFTYFTIWGWLYAFFQYRPGRPLFRCEFVGWENFTTLFGNKVMRAQLFHSLYNTFGKHFLGYLFTPLPMVFAILLNDLRSSKFKKAVQTITTLPNFISWVIVFSLATNIFATNGMVNRLLQEWGLLDKPINFLATDKHVWITQIAWEQWKGLGWSAIVYFAAISGIDPELYEAAMMDGAGKFARIWYITVPHLFPTYFVLLIMSIGNFLSSGLGYPLVFRNAMNLKHLETLDLYVYNLGIGGGQISYSVAVGIMKSCVAFVLFGFANWLSKKVRGASVF